MTGGLLGCKPEDTERVRGTFNRYGNAAEVGLQAQHDKPAALSMPLCALDPWLVKKDNGGTPPSDPGVSPLVNMPVVNGLLIPPTPLEPMQTPGGVG